MNIPDFNGNNLYFKIDTNNILFCAVPIRTDNYYGKISFSEMYLSDLGMVTKNDNQYYFRSFEEPRQQIFFDYLYEYRVGDTFSNIYSGDRIVGSVNRYGQYVFPVNAPLQTMLRIDYTCKPTDCYICADEITHGQDVVVFNHGETGYMHPIHYDCHGEITLWQLHNRKCGYCRQQLHSYTGCIGKCTE